jgi:hypothetical protein
MTADNLPINIGGLYSFVAPASGTACTFPSTLAPGGTCNIGIRYATPATLPAVTDTGLATVANNGTGTVLGVTNLVLSAR